MVGAVDDDFLAGSVFHSQAQQAVLLGDRHGREASVQVHAALGVLGRRKLTDLGENLIEAREVEGQAWQRQAVCTQPPDELS